MMSKKYRDQLEDQAKKQIILYAAQNPDWSPETLIKICKFFINHYGLRNRYLPPDFKQEENRESISSQEPQPDSGRIETTTKPDI